MLEKALELLKIFEENGYEAYIVGGFVRNYILNIESSDIDICTNATPKDIKGLFDEIFFSKIEYGSVKLTFKKVDFEITTYRIDIDYNGRSPSKIEYTNDLKTDLQRRDFTINTLCMDKDGKIIDKLKAFNDVKEGIIRSVGNASVKLKEDSLRILRCIRFASAFNFKIEKSLKNAIKENKASLDNLSFYRKKEELNKIFSSKNVISAIDLIKEYDLIKHLNIAFNNKIVKTKDPIGIWAQISFDERYPFTKNEQIYLKNIRAVLKDKKIDDIKLYKYGNYVCYIAAQILGLNEVNIYDRYDLLPIKKASDICLNAQEIIDILKLEDSSKLKYILKDLEEKIVTRKLDNNYDSIKKYLIESYSMI